MIPLDKMTDRDLLEMAEGISLRRRGVKMPLDARDWPRARLIEHIGLSRPPQKPRRQRRPRMPKNLGVGRFCHDVLSRVIGKTDDGEPVGLSYAAMVKMAQKKFPDSCVDASHLRWYACQMRQNGLTPPVHRARSRWI